MTLKIKRRLNEYFQQTTLHGWVYVAEEKGLLKLFWLVAMTGFVTLAFYFLAKTSMSTKRYLGYAILLMFYDFKNTYLSRLQL